MSELQNRIIERLGALDPLRQVALTPDKRERLMTAAFGLFYAAGGDADELKEIVPRPMIATAVTWQMP
jgi:hypothetical protein